MVYNSIRWFCGGRIMILNFTDVYYDKVEDVPLAVLIDDIKKCYYYPISYSIAEDLISASLGENDFDLPLKDIIRDLVTYSNAQVLSLSLIDGTDGKCSGRFLVRYHDQVKEYTMVPDQLILFSILFEIPIFVEKPSLVGLMSADSYYAQSIFDCNTLN